MRLTVILLTAIFLSGCVVKEPENAKETQLQKSTKQDSITKSEPDNVVTQVINGIAKGSSTALVPKYNSILNDLSELKKLNDPNISEIIKEIQELRTKEKVLYSDLTSIEILITQHKKAVLIPIEEAKELKNLDSFIKQVEFIMGNKPYKELKENELATY